MQRGEKENNGKTRKGRERQREKAFDIKGAEGKKERKEGKKGKRCLT